MATKFNFTVSQCQTMSMTWTCYHCLRKAWDTCRKTYDVSWTVVCLPFSFLITRSNFQVNNNSNSYNGEVLYDEEIRFFKFYFLTSNSTFFRYYYLKLLQDDAPRMAHQRQCTLHDNAMHSGQQGHISSPSCISFGGFFFVV